MMNSFNEIVPLSPTLELLPRETALSFASRLSAYCGCLSVQQFCLDFGLSLAKIKSGDEETLRKLAVLGGADPAELTRWSARVIRGRQKIINSQIVDGTKAASRLWSFCPKCGLEDIAAQPELPQDIAVYGRAEGQTSIVRTCPKHNIKLLQYEVTAKHRQADLGNFIAKFMAEIDSDTWVPQAPNPLELYAYARLTGSYHPSVDALDSLELWQAVSLTRALGAAIKGERGRLEQLDAKAEDEIETLGFTVFSGGHESLVEACRKMREAHWHDNARDGCLHRVGVALRGFQMSLGTLVAAAYISNAAFAVFPFKKGQLLFGMPCPETILQLSKNARQELGIGKTVWDAFMASDPPWVVFRGRDAMHTIVDVVQARSYFAGTLPFVSLRSAANRLEVHPRDLWRLVAAGQIQPVSFKALKSITPVYSLPAVERAVGLFNTNGKPGPAANDNEIPEGFMSLSQISTTYAIQIRPC